MPGASPEPVYCPHCRTLNARGSPLCHGCRMPLAPTASDTATGRPGGVLLRPMVPDSRIEKRRGARIDGVVVRGGGVVSHKVTVWNIHDRGLQFRTPFEFAVGVTVTLSLPLDGRLFTVRGEVRYAELVVDEREKTWACGVEFGDRNAALREAVARLPMSDRAA